ncbi:MAG: hypothetical protein OYH77_02880 [Pseudomonadota bacterium]|nr:hypothetical protein [Pseudomonadota bacterium]
MKQKSCDPDYSDLTTIRPSHLRCQRLRAERLHQTLFVIPVNDGEAQRASLILQACKAPHVHHSHQKWGATLDVEMPALRTLLAQPALRKVETICLFELPGIWCNDKSMVASEQELRRRGYQLKIIDHHYYHWCDRQNDLSSLEQLCAYIGWQMNSDDYHIAINDRSYIPALIAQGISRQRIRAIRRFDLLAQGWSSPEISKQQARAHADIELGKITVKDNLCVLQKHSPIVVQELFLRTPRLNALSWKSNSVAFSGAPAVVDKLFDYDFARLQLPSYSRVYGGGDRRYVKFFGMKTASPISSIQIQKLLHLVSRLLNL